MPTRRKGKPIKDFLLAVSANATWTGLIWLLTPISQIIKMTLFDSDLAHSVLFSAIAGAVCVYAFTKPKKPKWLVPAMFLTGIIFFIGVTFGGGTKGFKLFIRSAQISSVNRDITHTNKTWVLLEAGIVNSGKASIALNWTLELIFKDGTRLQMFEREINTNVFRITRPGPLRHLDDLSTKEVGKTVEWGWLSFYADVDFAKVISEAETCNFLLSVEDRDGRRFALKKAIKDFGPRSRLK